MPRTVYTHTDGDNDTLYVRVPAIGDPAGSVGFIEGDDVYLDREGAVGIITALTDLVEAADTEEAHKAAAEAAKEAARIKRGDLLSTDVSRYVALTDEADGALTVVNLDVGPVVLENARAGDFRIVKRAIS